MKFVADENFPRSVLRILRQHGYDVKSIAEERPGISDNEVLAFAAAEERTLLTFDKDFGDLAFRQGILASYGIILFRSGCQSPKESADLALATLKSGVSWAGQFCVVRDSKIRVTRLPGR